MRYYTWKLKWIDGYGYGPEQLASDKGVRLISSQWILYDIYIGTILGYGMGPKLNVEDFFEYNLKEISLSEALYFAHGIDPSAKEINGYIIAGSAINEINLA